MGFSTPIVGGVNTAGRKRPMTMPSTGSIEQKNPVRYAMLRFLLTSTFRAML